VRGSHLLLSCTPVNGAPKDKTVQRLVAKSLKTSLKKYSKKKLPFVTDSGMVIIIFCSLNSKVLLRKQIYKNYLKRV